MNHTHVNSIEETVIALRKVISEQAEISLTDIINIDSVRGAELTKVVDGVVTPYSARDTVIVFELVESNDLDLSMQLQNNSMLDISSHQLRLVIYGDNSRTVARRLKSRMWSQQVVNGLSLKGISLSHISGIDSSTEFVNTMRYQRRDMRITFIVSMQVEPVGEESKISTAEITIQNE